MIGANKETKLRSSADKMKSRTVCRVCGSADVRKFLALGPTPLANSYVKKSEMNQKEDIYPLDVYFCCNCHLVQLMDVVSPEIMFKDYSYITSASKPMQEHFLTFAKDAIKEFNVAKNSFVVDIGSNDGTLLSGFSANGMRVLGIEPATNIAKIAQSKGIPTMNDFFSKESALKAKQENGPADVILATNVFAHVDDLDGFMQGINLLLAERGTFIVECPYLLNLLKKNEFDTIYHEHLSYFSVHTLAHLFRRFGMDIVDVKHTTVHGGSIRVFVQRAPGNQSKNFSDMVSGEHENGLDSFDTFVKFADSVASLKAQLVSLLKKLKSEGAKITGYGATAKSTTLLSYCNIGAECLDYISDTTPLKQGTYTPGTHIPIVSEEHFHNNPGDYALLLAWNYSEAILKKEKEYLENGGKFIIPLPEPRIV